ncbi:type II toxin-antitoxin system PemK/MazF family toxin [Thioclava sp. 'Guangxiensis']|uniref:type II toxin-antitoxin system PemK/MazF family toxin n=1 Tax=Thioclava sp. 'Guangxiensis' TaxID=3149044 RepID=UPI003877FF56
MFDNPNLPLTMTSAWQDHISPGDIVTFRFPIRKANESEQPKPRPCLVIEVEEWAGKQFALLAYGTSSPRKANSGYEVHAFQPEDYTRFGLDRTTRFIGKRTIMVALDNPSFDSFRKTCSPVLGRLSGQPAERLLHVRARIQADRDMARDRQEERRRERRNSFSVEHRTPRRKTIIKGDVA